MVVGRGPNGPKISDFWLSTWMSAQGPKIDWMHARAGWCRPRSGPKWIWTWKSSKFMHALGSKQGWRPFSPQNALRLLAQIHILWGMQMQKLRNQIWQGFQCKKMQKFELKPLKCKHSMVENKYGITTGLPIDKGSKFLSPLKKTFYSSINLYFHKISFKTWWGFAM